MKTKFYLNVTSLFLAVFMFGCIKLRESNPIKGDSYPTMAQLDANYAAQWQIPKYNAANSAVNELI
jgi:hypothetical protein